MRALLGEYLNIEPSRVEIGYSDTGKPFLRSPRRKLHFNLSHSGTFALYGFSRQGPIGVDIEALRNLAHLDRIAAQFLTDEELGYLAGLPDRRRLEAFYFFWTVKEAYFKATGTGLPAIGRKGEIQDAFRIGMPDVALRRWFESLPTSPSSSMKPLCVSGQWRIFGFLTGTAVGAWVQGDRETECFWPLRDMGLKLEFPGQ